jgi:hypothetical protein
MGHTLHGWHSGISWVAVVCSAFRLWLSSNADPYRLYILEGIITAAYALACVFLVPKSYETAYFLNAEDKAIMRQRAEVMEAYSGSSGKHGKADIIAAAKDVKSWVHGFIQIAVVTILYGMISESSDLFPADLATGFGTFLPISE